MSSHGSRRYVEELLERADIRIGGDRPWDVLVYNDALFDRILRHGTLGLGEAYMDGWWDSPNLDRLVFKALTAGLDDRIASPAWLRAVVASLFNLQSPTRSFQVGRQHYDVGNDLYRAMLGERMIYSCGYWNDAETLDEAQEAKLALVCAKLDLKPGMRVLDIGCGWGGAAEFAARRFGANVVGVTVSEEQAKLARERCLDLPVDIRFQDYRALTGRFDRIFSLGMFEHVGSKNYRRFMQIVKELLAPDGLFLLHTIGGNCSVVRNDPWLDRYIFPNSMLPSARQIAKAFEGVFVLEDWQNFGADYDRTLMEWFYNFNAAWPDFQSTYGERFYRMWKYYLLSCAGSFRARTNQVWQVLLAPCGIPGGFRRWAPSERLLPPRAGARRIAPSSVGKSAMFVVSPSGAANADAPHPAKP